MPVLDLDASIVPRRAASAEEAAALVVGDGAAVVDGCPTLEAAVATATAVLGDRLAKVAPQFEATSSGYLANLAKLAGQRPDRRGRVRRFTPPDEVMVAHNDGYGFGDLAPDHLFLWCETADPGGGASWLVDGVALLRQLEARPDQRDLARFCWDVPVDHSEPGFLEHAPSPIARQVEPGRVQVRHQPYLAGVWGSPDRARHDAQVEAWHEAVRSARDRAERFHLEPGQLLCVDNYRVLHGRDPYGFDGRKVVSIWGWTTEAVAMPEQPVHLV